MASISLGVESSDIRSLFDCCSIVVRLLFDFYRISIEEETINNRQTIKKKTRHHRGNNDAGATHVRCKSLSIASFFLIQVPKCCFLITFAPFKKAKP